MFGTMTKSHGHIANQHIMETIAMLHLGHLRASLLDAIHLVAIAPPPCGLNDLLDSLFLVIRCSIDIVNKAMMITSTFLFELLSGSLW